MTTQEDSDTVQAQQEEEQLEEEAEKIQQEMDLEELPPAFDIDEVAPELVVDELLAEYEMHAQELEEYLPSDTITVFEEAEIEAKDFGEDNDDDLIDTISIDQDMLVLEAKVEVQEIEEEELETYELLDTEQEIQEEELESVGQQEEYMSIENDIWEEIEEEIQILEEDQEIELSNINEAIEELTAEEEVTELELYHLEKELESLEEELITEQVKETEDEETKELEELKHQEESQIEENSNVGDTDWEYEESEEQGYYDQETVENNSSDSNTFEATEYEETTSNQETEDITTIELVDQTEEGEIEEPEELEEKFELDEIGEIPETDEIENDVQPDDEIPSQQSMIPSEETYPLSEIIDIENPSIPPSYDIPSNQSIESTHSDDVPQQQSFGLSFSDNFLHNFSINLLDTEISALEKMLEEVESPRLLSQFHPQVGEDIQQILDIETHLAIPKLTDSPELVSQGPTLPEPPPYDFRAELEELEEEQDESIRGGLLQSLEKAKRIQAAASLNFALQKLQVTHAQSRSNSQKVSSSEKTVKQIDKSNKAGQPESKITEIGKETSGENLQVNQQSLEGFIDLKPDKYIKKVPEIPKSLEQRVKDFNLRMKFNEIFKQPTPDEFFSFCQDLYDEGVSKGRTFVRNTDADYFYLEDYTELANDIKLHSVLFDPDAPSRVPLDQPLLCLVGGGSRNIVGLNEKLLVLKSGKSLRGTYVIGKSKHFGGKDQWSKSFRYNSSLNRRNITKILFDGITEQVTDKKIIRRLRRINGLINRKYNSLNLYKIKHSFKDVEKVINAKLFEIYSNKTFSRRMRHSVRNRIRKLPFHFTTGGITNENFIVYHVELQQVLKRLMSINDNDLLKVESGELARQIVQVLMNDAKPLTGARNDGNTINLFKHVNSSKYSLDDKRFIQIANKSEKTKSGYLKCWYEACPEAWMNSVTRYILQDPEFRKALKLDYQKSIISIYTGQGRITKSVEPSGFPDITTIDMNGKAIDIAQVKQLGYNKPSGAVDLFRDISKTVGWHNSQGVKSALNFFVFESSDIARLNQLEKFGHKNVVIIGSWGNMKGITRFGEAVEAARIHKNVVSTSRISSMYLSKTIKNDADISKKLKKNWNLVKNVTLEGLDPISSDLLTKMKDEANLHSDPLEFYVAMIQFIGNHIIQSK